MTSHKSFKKAASLMLVAVLASRILGLVRDMLIARQFGQGGPVSAYTSAFNLPDLLYFFLSSGALSSAFIPVFTERFRTGREKEAWQIFSIIACLMGLVLLAGVIIFWVYARPLVSVLAVPGFVDKYPNLVSMTVFLTRIVLPCQLFFFLGGLMMGTLESRQKFSARAAGPVIYNIGIIFGAIVLSKWFHIAGLAWGAMIGAFAGNVGYAYYCLRKEGYEFYPSLNIKHPGVVKVGQLALPVILGLSLPQIDIIINRYFASFVSDSAPAALNFANRLMQVPLGIFAQAAGTAILPMLAAYAAQRAYADMRSGLAYGLRTILVENIPCTLFMVVMADPIVRTVYMNGNFKPSDVPVTAIALIFYSWGIFAWAGQAIVARGFFALQDTITPVVIGTVSTVVFIPTNFFLMKYMGIAGIALSTTLAATLHFLLLTFFLRKRLNGLEGRKTLNTAFRILVAASVMAVVCYGVRLQMSKTIGSWQLQDGDLNSPYQFALKIKNAKDPLSSQLQASLSPKTKEMQDHFRAMQQVTWPLRDSLTQDLNTILDSKTLYDKKRFHDVTLTKTTTRLLTKKPACLADQRCLNRGLLETAYSGCVEKCMDTTWLSEAISEKKQSREPGKDGSGWLLNAADIKDFPTLVAELQDTKDPVSCFILSKLSPATLEMLKSYAEEAKLCFDLPQSLMHDINGAITANNLYTKEVAASVKLPAKTVNLLESRHTGKQLVKANRLLLEAVYTNDVVKRPRDRVESRMASCITVLLAMFLGGVVYIALLRVLRVDEADFILDTIKRKILKRPGSVPPATNVEE